MSSPSGFSGTDPNARKVTQALRKRLEGEVCKFLKNGSFATNAPSSSTCCADWGAEEESGLAAALFANPSPKNTDSEALGEMGAIFYLQKQLDDMGAAYDDDNLQVFSGNGCFNLVYFHPDASSPTHAIILEAKGGNSQLGSREDGLGKNMRVDQGTPEYAETIIRVLQQSKSADRQATGLALSKLINKNPPKVAYIGVRTAYDKTSQLVHNPVPIFFEKV